MMAGRFLLMFALIACSGIATAEPIYNLTDLGTGAVSYTTSADGRPVVTNGESSYLYSPAVNHLPPGWQDTDHGLPPVGAAPAGTTNDSRLIFMNANGLAAGTNIAYHRGSEYDSLAFAAQLQPDGSWTGITRLWPGRDQFGTSFATVSILGVSNTGQVLGTGSDATRSPMLHTFLYDMNTHSMLDVGAIGSSIPYNPAPTGAADWLYESPIGIDEQGRLLVRAQERSRGLDHTLLLTPAGLTSGPLTVPEPGVLAMFAVVAGGLAIRQGLRRKGGE